MSNRAGRIEFGGLLAALLAGAVLAFVFLGWLPERARSVHSESLAPSSSDTTALAIAIEKLDQRLARIESSLAVQESRGTRVEVTENPGPGASASSDPSVPSGSSELHADLLQISKRIDLLAGSLKETYKPAYSLPTLEQIHAARHDVDWAFVDQLRQLCANDRDAARARVRFMTFDDVLRKIGLPNSIMADDGGWVYARSQVAENGQPAQQGVSLRFVGDTVSSVGAFP